MVTPGINRPADQGQHPLTAQTQARNMRLAAKFALPDKRNPEAKAYHPGTLTIPGLLLRLPQRTRLTQTVTCGRAKVQVAILLPVFGLFRRRPIRSLRPRILRCNITTSKLPTR